MRSFIPIGKGPVENLIYFIFFFQHAHFIPIVGVGKKRRILIGPW